MLASGLILIESMSLNTLCRVCAYAHSKTRLKDIFKTSKQSETIAERIHELTGLKVEIDDGLPSLCCLQCHSDLFRSVDTRRKCINSEKKLKSMLQADASKHRFPASVDSKPEPNLDGIKPKAAETCVFQNIECSVCQICFKDLASLHEHTEKNHQGDTNDQPSDSSHIEGSLGAESDDSMDSCFADAPKVLDKATTTLDPASQHNFKCCGCRTSYDTEAELMEHSQSVHALHAPMPNEARPFQCNICYNLYITARNVRRHRSFMCRERFLCGSCDSPFKSATALAEHEQRECKPATYSCIYCEETFHNAKARIMHEEMNHAVAPVSTLPNYRCCGCSIYFETENELMDHARSVHAPNAPMPHETRPTQCNICYRYYKNLESVRKHRGERSYQCATCGKQFRCYSHLINHENAHTKALVYPCRHCEEKFSNNSARRNHETRNHPTNEAGAPETHVCPQCGKTFFAIYYLKQHIRLHADETPYKCHCGAEFKLRVYLARHIKKFHTGEFTCQYCPKTFACRALLKGHENSHRDNREYACEICGKEFYSKSSVRKHRQKVHEKRRRRTKVASQ
uniref:Uncharacterized protein n=1 Tax=Anopheles atroparvus TaxID=41427 RepID=A0AAG5DTM9_ANOAO